MRAVLILVLLAGVARGEDLLEEATKADGAIEERVRLVLAHRLEGKAEVLAADVDALESLDAERDANGLPRTGLTDDVRYLAAGLEPTRDAQRKALRLVLARRPDPIVRKCAETRLASDDAAAADQLLVDDRHNRRAGVVNDFVRPLGIFSGGAFLAAANPFLLAGSALDSVATTAVNLWHYNRLSRQEREALVRYKSLLGRDPDTEEAPEIARAIHRLGKKRAETLCTDTLDLGKKALDANDLDHAAYYLRSAHRQDDACADRAAKLLERANEALARRDVKEAAARWPVDDAPYPKTPAESEDYEALLVATTLGDPGAIVAAANRFTTRHPDSEFEPGARYAVAVARDLAGHHDEARSALQDVARDDSSVGRHVAALVDSPDWNRLAALDDAERRHRRDRVRYVLLGGKMDGRSAMYTAAQFGASGMQAAESFGIFNVIGVLERAWQAWRKDPVSNQAIIDRGEELLAHGAQGTDAVDVHLRLADAYERAGNYGRALMHLQATPDPDAKRIAKLEGKLADKLLDDAEHAGSGDRALLETIVQHFGDTKAAEKARKKLADRPGDGDTVISREVLEANPSLAGPRGLDLDPRLLDGDHANGELADGGVTLADGEMRLVLYNTDGPGQHNETRPLDHDTFLRARAAAQEALYERILTAERKDDDVGKYERYVPFYIQGTVGDGGVYVYPGVKMRRDRTENPELYE